MLHGVIYQKLFSLLLSLVTIAFDFAFSTFFFFFFFLSPKSKILSKYMPNFIFSLSLYVIYILHRLHFIEKENNNNNVCACVCVCYVGPVPIEEEALCLIHVMPMSSKQQWHDDDMRTMACMECE